MACTSTEAVAPANVTRQWAINLVVVGAQSPATTIAASVYAPQSGEWQHRDTAPAFAPQVPGLSRLLGLTYAKVFRRLLSQTALAAIRGDGRSQSVTLLRWDRSPLLAGWAAPRIAETLILEMGTSGIGSERRLRAAGHTGALGNATAMPFLTNWATSGDDFAATHR